MSHFSPKSLAFYGCAIGSVVALFSLTTAYGEAHLQAPEAVDGRYPLTLQSAPACLQGKPLVLAVQQSGIYLTGFLLATDASEQTTKALEQRPSLSGRWENQQFSLAGPLVHLPGCQTRVRIEGLYQQGTLSGKLAWAEEGATEFTAQRQEWQRQGQKHE